VGRGVRGGRKKRKETPTANSAGESGGEKSGGRYRKLPKCREKGGTAARHPRKKAFSTGDNLGGTTLGKRKH